MLRTRAQKRPCAAGFPDFSFFRKLPRPYVQIVAYIDHFQARKKLGLKGLHWGAPSASFQQLYLKVLNLCFKWIKIGLYNLYSKGMAIGDIVFKLESCSFGPNTS